MISNAKLVRYSCIIFILSMILLAAYIGSTIILPILYGIFIAFVISPINKKIKRYIKYPFLSIGLSYLALLIPFLLITTLLSFQLITIMESLPSISSNLEIGVKKTFDFVASYFPFVEGYTNQISFEDLASYMTGTINVIGTGLFNSSKALVAILLAFLYSVFFVYYAESFKQFIIYQFSKSFRPEVQDAINKIKGNIRKYIGGLSIIIIILSLLNSLGLFIIGVDYALFWGILAGLLAIIPYIGTLIGGLLPFLYCLATSDYSLQPLFVALYYVLIQQIEGNLITPKIVGKEVDLNPLISIFSIIFFGAILGIGGIFLALPLMSILRIIFEHFESTKALAVLMGADLYEDKSKFKKIADS